MCAVTSTSQRHGLQTMTRVTLVLILWKKKKAKENKEELIDLSNVHSSSETLCPSTRNTRLKTEQI